MDSRAAGRRGCTRWRSAQETRTVYGESLGVDAPTTNHRGQVYRVYDSAGVLTAVAHDFKGNLLAHERRLAADYTCAPDWIDLALGRVTTQEGLRRAQPLRRRHRPLSSRPPWGCAGFRLQPVSKTSPRIGPGRGLAGRRNRSEPLLGSAQPNCRGWVGVLRRCPGVEDRYPEGR